MQNNKTFANRALKAMLVAGFAVSALPTTAFAVSGNSASQIVQSANQQKQIKGTVVDEFGEPMIGVTIKVKGGTQGAITDLDGNFTINVPANSSLEISYVGYLTETVKATDGLNVQLKPDTQLMDEVVVIGFGTVKKRDLTGSVSSVKSDAIVQAPTSDVASALQGRVTGLDINNGEMRIRGNRSINGNNAPLVIIDGVQGGSMGDLNPNDIESIDVLKDASSTAIYGSQGANGVIIITTKKAEVGKMNISYDGYVTGAFRPQHPDYRTGENYYEARRMAAANAGQWSSSADDMGLFGNSETFAAYKANVWTDYEDLLLKDITLSQKHTVTMAGGTDKTSARFSLAYANDGNKWKESAGTNKYILRANIDHKLYSWISAGVSFQLTHTTNEASPYERATVTSPQLGSPYGYYDAESGNYVVGNELVERPLNASGYVNPLLDYAGGNALYAAESKATNAVLNGYLDIHPIEGLTFRTQLNAHLTNRSQGSYVDKGSAAQIYNYTGKEKSTAQYTKTSGTYVEWNNILTYNLTQLPKDHHLGLTLLTTWSQKVADALSATSENQNSSANLWWNLASNGGEDGNVKHSSSYSKDQHFSYAGRISYDYKSKYLFTASLRRDGASVLAPGHKWDWFPSAAIAWRITDEPWMAKVKDSGWLDDLKLRATYGVTGNSGIATYGTQSGVTFANWSFGFQDTQANRYVFNNKIGNLDTKWEKSTTVDLGFDWSLLSGRVNVVFDWYNTKTTDLILLRDLPSTAGGYNGSTAFQTYQNIGATQNRGFEFTINARPIYGKEFKWNTTLSFSANSEKVKTLITGNTLQVGDKESGTYMVGYPIHMFYTYKYLGIWNSSEADAAASVLDIDGTPFYPGSLKIEDVDGDKVINDNDLQVLGSTSPKWFAGWNNDFTYKNWDFNIYVYARWGQWGQNPLAMSGDYATTGGASTNIDYWVAGTNEGGSFPMLYKGRQNFEYKGYQSLWYCDQSFIKLKRISVGYSLSKSALKSLGLEKVRIYATVNDPLYIVKSDFMKHRDPEGNQRSVTVGLNVNF